MSANTLAATVRTEGGKGHARRLRAAGMIPAVAYGKDFEVTPLSVSPKELSRLLGGERGLNTVIDLQIEGRSELVHTLVADYQIHPLTRGLLHADFKRVDMDVPVEVDVPLELTGRSKGVVMGGKLNQVYRALPVRCRPRDVPVKLVYDITELGLDAVAAVKDLSLPEGVEVLMPASRTFAAVLADKRKKKEGEEEDAAST